MASCIPTLFPNLNEPIEGVTPTIEGATLSAISDAQGQFQIIGLPVEPLRLLADGGTAQGPGTWPRLEYDLMPIPGVNYPMTMPIYLLPLDLPQGVQITETQGGTLSLQEMPGFE